MLSRLLRRFRPDPLRARVEASIRRGTGLRKNEWLIDELPIDRADIEETLERILDWCRDEISHTRRPYGIDQMALAVACAEPGGVTFASATFGIFRPVEFYQENGVAERVAHFMDSLHVEELNQRPAIRFAAALFSWGDVAHDTVFRDDDSPAAGSAG